MVSGHHIQVTLPRTPAATKESRNTQRIPCRGGRVQRPDPDRVSIVAERTRLQAAPGSAGDDRLRRPRVERRSTASLRGRSGYGYGQDGRILLGGNSPRAGAWHACAHQYGHGGATGASGFWGSARLAGAHRSRLRLCARQGTSALRLPQAARRAPVRRWRAGVAA